VFVKQNKNGLKIVA